MKKKRRARRGQLVTQYIEGISRSAIEEYQQLIRDFVRGRNGIYALYKRKRLHYVGLARNLRTRLKQHLTDRHGTSWDRFSAYLTPGELHVKELESLLIRIGTPPGNRVKGGFALAENLRRAFVRRVREDDKKRLNELLGISSKDAARGNDGRANEKIVLAPYAGRIRRIRARYKNKTYKARVLKNGLVSFRGTRFRSPSMAGQAILRRACNGWDFWMYERGPREWVKLDMLRR